MCENQQTKTKAAAIVENWIISFNEIVSHGITWTPCVQTVSLLRSVLSQVLQRWKNVHRMLFLPTMFFIVMHWQVKLFLNT